jgi:large subunit ribosomal protein L22
VHSAALLRYHTSKSATLLHKVLLSAMANAQENHRLSPEDLRISTIMIDEGPRLKRMRARAMGRGNRITKKTSHITVVVEDFEPEARVKPHGTKAKPRRSLVAPVKKHAKTHHRAEKVVEAPEPHVDEETPVVEASANEPATIEATPVSVESEKVAETTPEEEGKS